MARPPDSGQLCGVSALSRSGRSYIWHRWRAPAGVFAVWFVHVRMRHPFAHLTPSLGPFQLDWVFEAFDNAHCPLLQNKPKMFFIQACRGGQSLYFLMFSTLSLILLTHRVWRGFI